MKVLPMPSALFVALVLISFLPQVAGAAGTLFSAQGLPDCAEHEDFATSTYGMLQMALLPTNISSPEQDARVTFANGDYRLLAFGGVGGYEVPGPNSLDVRVLCAYGVRTFPGLTDAYESSEHRIVADKVRGYSKKYNQFLVTLLQKPDA